MKRIRTTGMIGWIVAAVSGFFAGTSAANEAEYKAEPMVGMNAGGAAFRGIARGRSFYGKTTGTRAAMREAKINRRWLAKQPK